MFSWKGFVAIVLATYLFLITLFFATSEKKLYGNACMHRDACVRFCCIDENLCTDKFIQTHFNSSKVLEIEGREDLVIKTRFGKPQCPLPLTLLEPGIPQFTPVMSKFEFLSFSNLQSSTERVHQKNRRPQRISFPL